jgi:hypothetical protein
MNTEKRSHGRQCLSADVTFSYFNKESSYFAQALNFGSGGMCINSSLLLKPGATLCIHLKKIHPEASGTGFCEGVRFVTLGEVKWCSEVPGDKTSHYAVGVKYFEPAY